MFHTSDLNVPEAETALHVSFLMLPEYTLSAFSNAIGILRMANRLTERVLYTWSVHSLDGQPVVSSAGLELTLDGSLADATDANILLVCAVATRLRNTVIRFSLMVSVR